MGTERRGNTFIDLIVAITFAIVLIPIAVSVVTNTRESADRLKCASNLKQIGQAILIYSNEFAEWPRTRYDVQTADRPAMWTGAASNTPFAPGGPDVNDITAAYRLLLAKEDLVAEVFLCPMSRVSDVDFARDRAKHDYANFVDERELSYSFANPYPNAAARDAGYQLTPKLSDEFAVASDVNPGVSPPDNDVTAVASTDSARNTKRGNSPNHDRDGQNVLYGDGHVEFVQSPFCGVARDNIFTVGDLDVRTASHGIVGSPAHAGDSVLQPTLDGDLWRTQRLKTQSASVVGIGVPTLIVLAIVVAIYRAVQFKSRRNQNIPTSV